MAWGLTVRIFQHLFDEGWLKEGDLTADCFGGIGVTGLVAASFGCPCILVELEEKFVDLAKQNFELHKGQWDKMGKPIPICVQGDSRRFASIIKEAIRAIITSPPWQQTGVSDHEGDHTEVVDSIITSPPYAESLRPETEEQTRRKQERIAKAKTIHNGRALEKPSPGKAALGGGYGISKGQLGAMKEGEHGAVIGGIVTSPPYAGSLPEASSSGIDIEKQWQTYRSQGGGMSLEKFRKQQARHSEGYGADPANVGNLPEGSHEAVVDAVVTSPPYMPKDDRRVAWGKDVEGLDRDDEIRGHPMPNQWRGAYSLDPTNIGNPQGVDAPATYWQAVSEVYQECFKALRPNGVCCVVVKAFVRNKQIIDLPSQTLELLEAIGFEPLERIRAWMTSPATQKSLMPDMVEDYTKKKASFFRRLYEKKYPENKIDFEEVLIVRKPISDCH